RFIWRADDVFHKVARRDGRRRLSAESIGANEPAQRSAVGGHPYLCGLLGGVLSAGLRAQFDSRCAANRPEHSAGVLGSCCAANSRAEAAAALPRAWRVGERDLGWASTTWIDHRRGGAQ